MKVLMVPNPARNEVGEGGVATILRAYRKHFPAFDIDLVPHNATSYDLLAVHAGTTTKIDPHIPVVAHNHGLYWTDAYPDTPYEFSVNAHVIESIRQARAVTVPSSWVAETLQRDMHLAPFVVGHGIDWEEWQVARPRKDGYVLWNKNRPVDVCNPYPVGELAKRFPKMTFISTFAPPNYSHNIRVTGTLPYRDMKKYVQRAGVYLATTKETFGIGILEAMASGVPVLGFRHGGICDIIKHMEDGYLAEPGNYEDLQAGLNYCLLHGQEMGDVGRERAKLFTWERVAEQMRAIYDYAIQPMPSTCTIVIPAYNKAQYLAETIESALKQTFKCEIIVVDNNSTDDTPVIAKRYVKQHKNVHYLEQEVQGVAHARNMGIAHATTKYICCLDGDDKIAPTFIEKCVNFLEENTTYGLAYTGITGLNPNGSTKLSEWPGEYNYDAFLQGHNQVPTCCVFRREAWARLGGYRQRYAPQGAGAEDAEFWLRMGAFGWNAKKITDEGLFIYRLNAGFTATPTYKVVNWRQGHPWVEDGKHPFASMAKSAQGSHPVRQYDAPEISVVIPCGPGHEHLVIDAVDSVEAQTYRQWEVIVVFDTGKPSEDYVEFCTAFPFAKVLYSNRQGAGHARNAGAKIARGKYLLFLDADDWLQPTCLEKLLKYAQGSSAISYSDYTGHAFIDGKLTNDLRRAGRLLSRNDADGYAQIAYRAFEYDCEKALKQPDTQTGDFYIWSLVASLVPKAWHEEIGGFDEEMESWEDWDYWLRLARLGKCFVRVPERLVDYRFFSGNRRENARQIARGLVEYMQEKYRRHKTVPCGGCGKRKSQSATVPAVPQAVPMATKSMPMTNNDLIMVRLNDGNVGQHPVVGGATRTQYGYRVHGEQFLVHKLDLAARPKSFISIEDVKPEPEFEPEPIDEEPLPIQPVLANESSGKQEVKDVVVSSPGATKKKRQYLLEDIDGMTPKIAQQLRANNINNPEDLLHFGRARLLGIKYVGETRADSFIAQARAMAA